LPISSGTGSGSWTDTPVEDERLVPSTALAALALAEDPYPDHQGTPLAERPNDPDQRVHSGSGGGPRRAHSRGRRGARTRGRRTPRRPTPTASATSAALPPGRRRRGRRRAPAVRRAPSCAAYVARRCRPRWGGSSAGGRRARRSAARPWRPTRRCVLPHRNGCEAMRCRIDASSPAYRAFASAASSAAYRARMSSSVGVAGRCARSQAMVRRSASSRGTSAA
jgi:hypothetical protein